MEKNKWFIVGRFNDDLKVIPIDNILFDLQVVCVPERLAKLHWVDKMMADADTTIDKLGVSDDKEVSKLRDAYKRKLYRMAFKDVNK